MWQPVILFPGQGSQVAGMGRDLAEASAEAMDTWKLAERVSNLPLREIYWEGDEQAMSDTRALQPALTVTNCNLWREMAGRVKPAGMAGHSLGELHALACAGAFSLKTAIELTALRGRLMAEADPDGKGGMAAIVKLDEGQVQAIVAEVAAECGEMLLVANYNTPVQLVLSGTKKAVALACEKAKAQKGRGIELAVSGAFHSPMMQEANAELAGMLEKADWNNARVPVYCNVDGRAASDAHTLKANLLRQMVSPVRWVDTVRNQHAAGVSAWLELGPKAVLGKMVGPCLAGVASDEQRAALKIDIVSDKASLDAFVLPE